MAIKTLSQIEREYFARKLGGAPSSETLNQIKRRYWIDFLSADTQKTLAMLESEWQDKVIVDLGGTSEDKFGTDSWATMVALLGLIPTKQVNGNKRIFYLNAE